MINLRKELMHMKIKKIACLLLAIAMIWTMASCGTSNEDVTELTDPPGTQQTTSTDPPDTSEPDVTEPDVTEPDVTDPTGPADPVDPTDPSEPDVPVHQHSYAEEVTKATCTEDGYTTYTCDCGDTYTGNKVAATGHNWNDWVTIEEPTQTTTGLAGRNCTVCGEKETKVLDVVIPDHTHSYTGEVTKAATCTAEGVKTFTCSCGSSYTEKIEKISHSYKETVTKPTCTAKGYTTFKCSACGDSYKDSYVAAIGHKYGAYTSNGDASCTADGTKTATCSNGCGTKNTVTDTGSAKGHSYKETVTAATCTAQGYTTHKCGTCGDSYKDSYTDKVDHSYSVVSTKEPTLWAQGSIKYKCGTCSSTYTEYTDPLTGEAQQAYLREIAAATLKYINQFREEQGDTAAISLPGLTLVAEYRAVQLQTNYAHSTTELREALAHYEYGEWVDGTLYGGTQQYYTIHGPEAIQQAMLVGTADEIGYEIARSFRNSANHWSYVGSSEYAYIGIGITFDASEYYPFKICVLQTNTNYG